MPKENKVSVLEYAEKHNPVRNNRGHKMSAQYLYRLIQHDIKGVRYGSRELWFKYVLEGNKDRIYIII
jgi:hypothetical protein